MKITNEILTKKANEIGFDLVGFSRADKLKYEIKNLEEWLRHGYQGSMTYMEKNVEKRSDVKYILQDAKSVISLALNYYTGKKYSGSVSKGKVSRYAWGTDYHLIIWEKLSQLEKELKEIDQEFESKSYVDTGPVMDKVWAVKSGLGWMGKHTNVINKNFGSWIFLSTIITNYEFEYLQQVPDFCGTCTACLDSCPTDAITQEYVVDANKCISFLTIENKNEIPDEFHRKFDGWLFGCDLCQDVCPWNIKFSKSTAEKEFYPANNNNELDLAEVINMNENEFKLRFERSPVKRTRLRGLKRNAGFLLK